VSLLESWFRTAESTDKTFLKFSGLFHSILQEITKTTVYNELFKWMDERQTEPKDGTNQILEIKLDIGVQAPPTPSRRIRVDSNSEEEGL